MAREYSSTVAWNLWMATASFPRDLCYLRVAMTMWGEAGGCDGN